jgi:hypothetical protein
MRELGVLIPIIALIIPIVAIITKGRQKRLETELQYRNQSAGNADAVQMQQEIRALKERIIVLERVITDTSSASDLDREIEKLR